MDEAATTSPSTPVVRPNPFAPQHCPDCGYALTGLPPAGRCPECGIPYDETMLVIYGYGAGQRSHAWNSEAGRNPWMHAVWFVVTAGALAYIWWTSSFTPRLTTLFLIALAGSAAFSWWRGRNITSPKPTQLRLTPEGFAQRDGFGNVRLIPWTTRWLWFRIRRNKHNRWQIDAGRGWPRILILWTWVGIEVEAEFSDVQALCRRLEAWNDRLGSKARLTFREKLPWWHLTA